VAPLCLYLVQKYEKNAVENMDLLVHIKKITLNHALLKLSHERLNCSQFDTCSKYFFFNMQVHLGICFIFFIN
jgi:hypothetical protein